MVVLVVAMKGVMGVAGMVDLKQLGVGWLVGGCARQVGKQEAKIVISDSLAWDNQEST